MLRVSKDGEVVVTPFSKFIHKSESIDLGSMIIQNYDFSWDNDIRDFIVVEADKEDRQAYIDSFADDCGVYNILKKYSVTGDVSLLNSREGVFADITGLPVDELNPGKFEAAAATSVESLNKKLGTDLTGEELANMSSVEIESLINKIVEQKLASVEKKEGNENA